MYTLKLIPAIVFSLFASMAAPMVAQPMRMILHVGESDGALHDGLQALCGADELEEMSIGFQSIQPDSDRYTQYVNEYGLARDSAWALMLFVTGEYRYRCLIQGSALPTVADIQKALYEAGVKGPIRTMRDFLKQHPDHLDARLQLLDFLRVTAEDRTMRALQLNSVDDPYHFSKYHIRLESGAEMRGPYYRSVAIDTSALDDKQLDPEQDIVIWGPYAQELQTLFASGDWRLVDLGHIGHRFPVEACSPMMVQIYRSYISKVEAFLEEYPSNPRFWDFYGWIASITKHGSVRVLFDRIAPTPIEHSTWFDEQLLSLLIPEEETKGNWGYIAETLWPKWSKTHRDAIFSIQRFVNLSLPPAETELMRQGQKEAIWKYELRPLIEALIKTNRIADAETVILDYAKFATFKDYQSRAANLALACNRRDLQTKWLAFQIPEVPLRRDLDFSDYASPILVTINGEETYNQKIDAMLKQSRIIDWDLRRINPNAEWPELLRQREGWQEGETHWALLYQNKILAHGLGSPTEDALVQELELSRVRIPANILRRFVVEHPAQFEAKEELLLELKRLAEKKTLEKLGKDAGTNTERMLSDEDDQTIWGEYAYFYRQILPYLLEQGRRQPWIWYNSSCDSSFFIHSRTMKSLAHLFLPRLEAALTRQPSEDFLWGAWSAFSMLDGRRHFRDIKDTLVLQPIEDPLRLPPDMIRASLLRLHSTRSEWQDIVDIQEWRWETTRGYMEKNPATKSYYLNQYFWPQWQSLLEAYLRLGKNGETNELIRIWSQSPDWQEIKQNVVALAKRCDRAVLAEQWNKL
jgi:hypothetical protein